MRNFRKLEIWNNGMTLVKKVYTITNDLPSSEKFGLVSQMRRCAVSIPSNIAEGCSRNSEVEYKRFLEISMGSAFELETQLVLCSELNYIDKEKINPIINELNLLQRQTNALIKIIAKKR